MFRTVVRGMAVTGVMAALIGGAAAGAAQAQQIVRPANNVKTADAVAQQHTRDMQSRTRDMTGSRKFGPPGSVPAKEVTLSDGSRLRSCASVGCVVLGLGYSGDYAFAECWLYAPTPSGKNVWYLISDYTRNLSGWTVTDNLASGEPNVDRCGGS
jgi:hypothetical protein